MEQLKGYDASPPRNGTIFFYAILTVVLLVLLKFALDSYFYRVMDAEHYVKVASRGMEPVREMRKHEAEVLEKAGLERAMQVMAQRGRGASPMIKPESGAGKPAVAGWTQLRPAEAAPAEGAPAEGEAPPAEGEAAPVEGEGAGEGAAAQGAEPQAPANEEAR